MEAARQEVARARGLGEAGEAARWRQEAARRHGAKSVRAEIEGYAGEWSVCSDLLGENFYDIFI